MFTIKYVKDLKWENENHTLFSCVVKYDEFDEEHPTGVNATDKYSHIQEIWNKASLGEYGEIAEFIPSLGTIAEPIDPNVIPSVVIDG